MTGRTSKVAVRLLALWEHVIAQKHGVIAQKHGSM